MAVGTMNDFLFTIKLHIYVDLDFPEARQAVEEAMNVACHHLETSVPHDSISYGIREAEEL
jgi:hypothetical protein